MGFAHIGRGLRLGEIAGYVGGFDFGTVLPDFVVFHHSMIPSASWAPARGDNNQWDTGEQGLSEQQIYDKRKARIDWLARFYASKGWSAGPHAFIDERWVWLMTPLSQPGVHAKWGNSFRRGGRLHYSIGIEMIGNFATAKWHPSQAALAGAFVGAVQRRLGTFQLDYMYHDPASKPGMVGTGDNQACRYPERLRWGGLSSHRDYNKPECPGNAITESYYIDAIRRYANAEQPAGTRWRVRDHLSSDPADNFAAVRTAANKNADPARIGPNPVRLGPGFVVESDTEIGGWLHIQKPDAWGYAARSLFEPVDPTTPLGPRT